MEKIKADKDKGLEISPYGRGYGRSRMEETVGERD